MQRAKPGKPLPTSKELSQRYGVSTVTIDQVFASLQREGLVVSEPGSGRFKADR